METYNPDNYPGKRENQFQNPNPETMQYNDSYYYGNGQTAQSQPDYMGMNAGFE